VLKNFVAIAATAGSISADLLAHFSVVDAETAESGLKRKVFHVPEAKRLRTRHKKESALAPEPSRASVEPFRTMGVAPLSVGRSIIAAWEPNERPANRK
jgi:hypothetical protein